jgi:hypothetical protein
MKARMVFASLGGRKQYQAGEVRRVVREEQRRCGANPVK